MEGPRKVLSFEEYSKNALSVEKPARDVLDRLDNAALGLAGEAGEVADIIKKVLHQEHPLDAERLAKLHEEAGDVLWYLNLLCDAIGTTLEEVAAANNTKLFKRYPGGFTRERSLNRDE